MSGERTRSRLASTASAFVVAAAIQRLAPFLLLLVLVRYFSVAEYGQVGVLTSLYVLGFSIGGLGLEAAAFRGHFLADGGQASDTYYPTLSKLGFWLPVLLACSGPLLLLVLTDQPFGIESRYLAASLMASLLVAAGSTIPLARMRAQERTLRYVSSTLAVTFAQVLTKFFLCVFAGLGVEGWVIGDLVAGVVAIAINLPFQARDLVSPAVSTADARSFLRLGLPLLPHVVASWVLSLSDRLLVAGLVGAEAAGRYGLAAQLSSIGMILCTELNRALASEYGKAIKPGADTQRALSRIVALQRTVTIGIFLATAAGSALFVQLFAPPTYHSAVSWCLILCAGLMLYALYYPPMDYLSITLGRTGRMPLISLSAALINVGLNVLLLRHGGAVIAAYTTVAGYAALLFLTTLYAGRPEALRWTSASLIAGMTALAGLIAVGVFWNLA